MKVEEIVMRQEIRQMLNEIGINRDTLRGMVTEVIHEEVDKQIKKSTGDNGINSMVSRMVYDAVRSKLPYDIGYILKDAVREEIHQAMRVKIDVAATVIPKDN